MEDGVALFLSQLWTLHVFSICDRQDACFKTSFKERYRTLMGCAVYYDIIQDQNYSSQVSMFKIQGA